MCSGAFFYTKISGTVRCTFKVHRWEGEINMMEFVEGVKAKETLGIAQILEGSYEGKKIRMNGAVHNVRDMGEVAFAAATSCSTTW